jgi:hypothetical protein
MKTSQKKKSLVLLVSVLASFVAFLGIRNQSLAAT